jgi:type I restriction enzyme, S subunit
VMGATINQLTNKDLAVFKVALPKSEAEQTAIANALSDADALIGSLQKLITKKRQIKQGAMQTLLNPYENGVLKAGWQISSINAVSKEPLQNGVFFKPSLKGIGVKLINVSDLYGQSPIKTDDLDLFAANLSERDKFKVENGDLFFTRSSLVASGIAHCNIYLNESLDDVVFDSHVIRLKPNSEKINPSFLFRFCTGAFARKYLVSHSKTATMTTIDQTVLGNCAIFFPDMEKQLELVSILEGLDSDITALETKLSKYQQIKQGMMQNLLTGKIRLV